MHTPSPLEDIFFAALQKGSAGERAAYLDAACASDCELRGRIEKMLAAHAQAESFLEVPAGEIGKTIDQPPLVWPGTQIGPCKLLQQIGEGGMGVVYMAEQQEPVERRVALKIIKPGMDTRQVIARFEAERQALAMMDHPNIAKVLDAGATDTGRPYFIMELVKGVPITQYCDEHHLTPKERLELFLPVLQAVQHAHQKGIIHRDIKPTNVLVAEYDDRPVPKVIDFGVAKATSQKLTEKTMFTQYGQLVGTLDYMSPEQAKLNQMDIDTRSDIYSLGVLLYELLTGETPFDRTRLRSATFEETMRIIREEEPPKPSTRLSSSGMLASVSANRNTEPRKLSALVRGELDWIVMKALDKDRGRRYETANGFAADVQRYLDNEPVEACPPSARYRVRKFVRRHRGVFITAVLVSAAMVVALVTLVVSNVRIAREQARAQKALQEAKANYEEAEAQRNRAQKNVTKAFHIIDSMLTNVAATGMIRDTNMESMRHEVLQKAIMLYQEFLQPEATDSTSREETAYAYLQLINTYDLVGQADAAEAAGHQAQQRYEQLRTDFPGDPRYWTGLAVTHQVLGNRLTRTMGRQREAEQHLRRAIDHWKRLGDEDTTEATAQYSLAQCSSRLGYLVWSAFGESDEGEQLLRQAVDLGKKLVADNPRKPTYMRSLVEFYISWGVILRMSNRLPEAESALRAGLEMLDEMSADPNGGDSGGLAARALGHLESILRKTGRPADADAVGRRAMELKERVVADYPLEPGGRHELAAGYRGSGVALEAKGRLREAEAAYRRALAMQEILLADFSDFPDGRGQMAETLRRLANLLRNAGRGREAHELCDRMLKLTPDSVDANNNLAWYLVTTPDLQFRDAKRAVELATTAVELAPQQGTFWNTLGVAQFRSGNWRDAIASLEKSRELFEGRVGSVNWFFLAMAHWCLDEKDEARKCYDQAVAWMEQNKPADTELLRFRQEAEELLGVTESTNESEEK